MIDIVYHMGQLKLDIETNENEEFEDLICQLGKLLADEYIDLMQKEESTDESGDLCKVLQREPAAGEY